MQRATYSIVCGENGQWAVCTHGVTMQIGDLDEAIRCAMIAAKTERLNGAEPTIMIEQPDGSFKNHVAC
jgi:hypothetical protein